MDSCAKNYYEEDFDLNIENTDVENEEDNSNDVCYDETSCSNLSAIDLYIKELNRSCPPKLSPDETIELGRIIKEGSPEEAEKARNRLIEGHLLYALKLAKAKRRSCGPNLMLSDIGFQDVIQEATLGLYDAIDKYDYTKGIAFGTYAKKFVDKRIQMCFCNVNRSIKVSEYYKNHEAAYRKWLATRRDDSTPTEDEVAEALGVSKNVAKKFLQYFITTHSIFSLDQDAQGDHDSRSGRSFGSPSDFLTFIPAPPEYEPTYEFDKRMSEALRHEKIMSVFNDVLTPRERDCLLIRFNALEEYNGVRIDTDNDKPATYEFIGNLVGCGKVLAFYAVSNALKKLREKYNYNDFTF